MCMCKNASYEALTMIDQCPRLSKVLPCCAFDSSFWSPTTKTNWFCMEAVLAFNMYRIGPSEEALYQLRGRSEGGMERQQKLE